MSWLRSVARYQLHLRSPGPEGRRKVVFPPDSASGINRAPEGRRKKRIMIMGSTYTSLWYHIVWSTKEPRNFIEPQWEPRLHAWLGGAIRHIGGVADTINGMGDHIHILASLRPVRALAKVLCDIKGGSSEWVHKELRLPMFGWQDGYFAVTVSPTQLEPVRRYIRNQKRHHAQLTWEEELKGMLEKAGIKYDPKYLL